jgi:hypothetical protein
VAPSGTDTSAGRLGRTGKLTSQLSAVSRGRAERRSAADAEGRDGVAEGTERSVLRTGDRQPTTRMVAKAASSSTQRGGMGEELTLPRR